MISYSKRASAAALSNLTDLTMEVVLELSEPTESILDIGAGTGRMSLPLIESNFYVVRSGPKCWHAQSVGCEAAKSSLT